MKTTTLFQVRFRPSVKPPRGFTKSAHYNVLSHDRHNHKYLIGNTWLPAKDFIKIEVEDAPVFNKPVLRKIASLKPDEVIECNTDAELKAVLEQAEREGFVWQYSGRLKPTKYDIKAPHCIGLSDKEKNCIALVKLEHARIQNFVILPASKFVEVAKVEAEPITPEQKDECVKLQERIKELEALCELRLKDQEGLADEAENYREANALCISRINRIENFAKSALQANNETLHKVALRAIANGEI